MILCIEESGFKLRPPYDYPQVIRFAGCPVQMAWNPKMHDRLEAFFPIGLAASLVKTCWIDRTQLNIVHPIKLITA